MSMSMLWSAQYLKMSESIVTPVLEIKISIDTDPFVRNTQTDIISKEKVWPSNASTAVNQHRGVPVLPGGNLDNYVYDRDQQPGDKSFFSCLVLPQRPCVFVERTAPPWMWDTRQPLILFDSQFLKCVWKLCGNLHLPGSHDLATHCTANATPVSLFCSDLRIATITTEKLQNCNKRNLLRSVFNEFDDCEKRTVCELQRCCCVRTRLRAEPENQPGWECWNKEQPIV